MKVFHGLSIEGMGNLFHPEVCRVRKTIWFILICLGVGFLCFHLYTRAEYYMSGPMQVDLESRQASLIVFPTITLSFSARNWSGVENKALKWKDYGARLPQWNSHLVDGDRAAFGEASKDERPMVDDTYVDRLSDFYDMNINAIIRYLMPVCYWNREKCERLGPPYFKYEYGRGMFHMIFNPDGRFFVTPDTVFQSTLSVVLRVPDPDVIPHVTLQLGRHDELPQLIRYGLNLPTQTDNTIQLKYVEKNFLPGKNCQSPRPGLAEFFGKNAVYTSTRCLYQCAVEHVYGSCGVLSHRCVDNMDIFERVVHKYGRNVFCHDESLNESDKNVWKFRTCSDKEVECLNGFRSRRMNEFVGDFCRQCTRDCREVDYGRLHSWSWLLGSDWTESEKEERQKQLKVTFAFDNLETTVLQQSSAYDLLMVLADFGGCFGLFLGACGFTIIQLLDNVFVTLLTFYQANNEEKKRGSGIKYTLEEIRTFTSSGHGPMTPLMGGNPIFKNHPPTPVNIRHSAALSAARPFHLPLSQRHSSTTTY